jgi:hypothetical protein
MYHSRVVLSIGGPVWYMVRNHRCTVPIDSVWANSETQNAFLSPGHTMFRHDCPLAVKPASTQWRLLPKQTWTDSLPIDMLLSVASVLVVAKPISEFSEGLMNYPVHVRLQYTSTKTKELSPLSYEYKRYGHYNRTRKEINKCLFLYTPIHTYAQGSETLMKLITLPSD